MKKDHCNGGKLSLGERVSIRCGPPWAAEIALVLIAVCGSTSPALKLMEFLAACGCTISVADNIGQVGIQKSSAGYLRIPQPKGISGCGI